jgi:hypothetical protein
MMIVLFAERNEGDPRQAGAACLTERAAFAGVFSVGSL